MRGRRPKPPQVRQAEGNPGHRPIPVHPRVFSLVDLPDPPSGLSPAGERAWREVGDSLAQVGALSPMYLPLLTLFAQAVDLADQAWNELQEAGSVVRPGRERGANPAVRVWRDAAGVARSLGEQLGASPVALTRLGLTHVRGLTLQQELKARQDQLERKPKGKREPKGAPKPEREP